MKLIVLKNNVPINDIVIDTTDVNQRYEIYVGRSEDCHVQINDPLISRHHLIIKNESSKWFCEKLTQLGVITLNGSLVSSHPVKNGDELKFGEYSIIVTEINFELVQEKATIQELETPQTYTLTEETSPLPVSNYEPIEELIPEDNQEVLAENPENEISGEINENYNLSEDENNLENISSEPQDNDFINLDSESSNDQIESSEEYNSDSNNTAGFDTVSETSEENFDVALTDDNDGTQVFKSFVHYQLTIFGDHAPYDRFLIDNDEVFIGRDTEKCQIILEDPEVSSVHAVLRKFFNEITIEDLNSSNGTILNGERINKAVITAGDEFIIGSTTFTLETKSDLYESESERLMPVESGQIIETEEIVDEEVTEEEAINFSAENTNTEKSIIKRIWRDPVKRKKAIYILAGVTLVWVLFAPDEQPEPTAESKTKTEEAKVANKNEKPKRKLSPELENTRNVAYELGVSYFEQSRYDLAQVEFQKVFTIDPEYKKIQSYLEQTNSGLKRLQELEAERRAEEDRIKNKKMIEELIVKARDSVKERNVLVAETLFSQIIEKDPENIEVSQLKLELEAWQKEEERKALEKAAKEASRKKMVDALLPAKTFYLKNEWFKAILKLEEFLRIQGLDEDLIKEATEMLGDSKTKLSTELEPILGKARSSKEGQDLKQAYESFLEALKVDPTNSEALNEIDDIKFQLDSRSKKIYREAIIAESLSLFGDAKEKFLEVQQISPTDSEYYKKASEKLKNYLE